MSARLKAPASRTAGRKGTPVPLNIERIRELTAEAVEGGVPPITDAQADELVAWMTPDGGGSGNEKPEKA